MRGGGGGERGAGRGAQKEARDKVTRMDEGSEQKWNRWRRGRREERSGEHVEGKRERGKVLNEEEEEMEVDEGVRRAREETWRSGTSDY